MRVPQHSHMTKNEKTLSFILQYVLLYVCVYVCVYVCLSLSTITQEIPNIFIRNFLNAFPIG
jgi:hypothetical protein